MDKPEKSTVVDQLQHPAPALLNARPELFARQGAVVATYRRRNGKTFGPYFRLAYRAAGRQVSVYLGRAGALVEAVRRKLAELQRHIQAYRMFERVRRSAMSAIRARKIDVRRYLHPFGLRLKGLEVRGWRTSVFRRAIRRFRLSPRMKTMPRCSVRSQTTSVARMLKRLERRDGRDSSRPCLSPIRLTFDASMRKIPSTPKEKKRCTISLSNKPARPWPRQ